MGEALRLRVVFEDAGILSGSQRRRGLQRCWLQLRPGIVTIADLAAHVQVIFGLQSSCPHGLIISIDGFVLPSFESTCILKDEDIIMIKKNGVVFQDILKLRGSQNQEQVLQSRQISAFNNRSLAIMDAQVDSQGFEKDAVLLNRSTVHIETPRSKKMNECRKRKRSNKHQGSNNTLAIKDSQGDSQGDEENVGLHGNIAHKESTSNEDIKHKKKHSNELLTPDTLVNKDSQADSQLDIGDLSLPIPHKETSSSEMIKLNRKRKHFDKLQCSDDTLACKASQRNSEREEDNGLHGNIAHKEATSNKIMRAKYKRKLKAYPLKTKNFQGDSQAQGDSQGDEENVGLHGNIAHKESTSNEDIKRKKKHSNELLTPDTLVNKDSQADSQLDIGDLSLPIPHKETSSSEMIKLNRKRKHFDELQGSDDTLACKDSQRNSEREEENGLHGNIAHKEATSNKMMLAKYKRKLKAYPLKTKNSQGDSQVDEGDWWLPNGKATPKETSCEMKNAKHEGKHSNKPQGLDDTLAIKDSQGYSKCDEGNVGLHGNIASLRTISNEMMNTKSKKNHSNKHHISDNTLAVRDSQGVSPGDGKEVGLPNGIAPVETPIEITNVIKRQHSNKLQASENQSKGNDDGHASKNDSNGDTRKVMSRSARRKKAKRSFFRIFGRKKEKKLIEIEIPEGDNHKKTPEHANADQITYVDNEIVPVIVRTGHIRFESSDTCSVRADQPVQSVVQETFQWNGTTCKKKGQKLGRENTFNKWNDDTSNWLSYGETSNAMEAEVVEVSNEKSAVEKVDAYKGSIVNKVEPVKECNGNSVANEFEAVKELIEFESFSPLLRLPEEGDVLVYRLVELSSSWCPELSPFRVGRVSSYDCSSSKVILLPLPEYPILLEEILEEGEESRSLYKEDGTLEVDFASLVDVRLLKACESMKTTPSTTPIEEMQNAVHVNNQESAPCSNNRIEISSDHTESDQFSEGWEAINQALNEKKSQLQKENGLDKRNSSLITTTTGSWSYRALRRNALGPTLAMLRSSDGDSGK